MTVEQMKSYYEQGLWSKERIDKLLEANKITQSEYDEILGQNN